MIAYLVLVPTQFELDCLSDSFREMLRARNCTLDLCGFGPIVSGIRTAQLIALHNPNAILLIGIAGALRSELQVGTAIEFDEVGCYGIGAGSGDSFLTAGEIGWRQWGSEDSDLQIQDIIACGSIKPPLSQLLTCCAASANDLDRQQRLKKFPMALAEDMEGFAVAAACQFSNTPLRIVRGISNQAGDRNKSNWKVVEAIAAVEQHVLSSL